MKVSLSRILFKIISDRGARRRLSLLNYHQVLPNEDPLRPDTIHASVFEWQMEVMAHNFTILPLYEAISLLEKDRLPPHCACITFDDGYADNYNIALPILKNYGLSATFFVASGFLNGGRMWNDTVIEAVRGAKAADLDLQELELGVFSLASRQDRLKTTNQLLGVLKHREPQERLEKVEGIANISEAKLPDGLMMKSEEVRALADAGMEIGGHTVNHPILTSVSREEARREIMEGREQLEAITGRAVQTFAYPNGKAGKDYSQAHVDLVRDLGFIGAVTTEAGVATKELDCYQLPRFTPWDRTPARFLLRLALNGWNTKPESVC